MLARIMVVVGIFSVANASWAGSGPVGPIGYVYTDFGIGASPGGIVAGPDGAMWFTDHVLSPGRRSACARPRSPE